MTASPLKIRFGNGAHYSKSSRFGMAIEKFGWDNIEHEVLETGLTLEQAYEKEKYYIKLYNTTDDEFGYNMADGGKSKVARGRKVTEETRRKIAKSNRGQKRSEETKEKLRMSHIGQESHNVKAVIKFDLHENALKEYKSVTEAVRSNEEVSNTAIWRACTGRRKTAGGYVWKYK